MAQFTLRNKIITIDDELYRFMKDRYYEFDEDDCKSLIRPILTTGDLKKGFKYPDMDEVVEKMSNYELSSLLERGILLQKEVMR